MSSSQHQELVP
uniref:Uncharacterized protein n=1 Tax=Arundo donax TaxID=35708 RepID=A0A0A9FEI4_ARUDO